MSAWTPWWARHDHPRQIDMPTTEHTGEPTPQFGPTPIARARPRHVGPPEHAIAAPSTRCEVLGAAAALLDGYDGTVVRAHPSYAHCTTITSPQESIAHPGLTPSAGTRASATWHATSLYSPSFCIPQVCYASPVARKGGTSRTPPPSLAQRALEPEEANSARRPKPTMTRTPALEPEWPSKPGEAELRDQNPTAIGIPPNTKMAI